MSEDLACTASDHRAKVSELRLGDMQCFPSLWAVVHEGAKAVGIAVCNSGRIRTSCGYSIRIGALPAAMPAPAPHGQPLLKTQQSVTLCPSTQPLSEESACLIPHSFVPRDCRFVG